MQKTFIMHNESELESMIAYMQKHIKRNTVVLLKGDLGSGKTTVVKHFASNAGLDCVSSPSFNIIHTYENSSTRITHADLYRLSTQTSFEELNLYEEIERSDYTFIEWPLEGIEKSLRHYNVGIVKMFTDGNVHRAEVCI